MDIFSNLLANERLVQIILLVLGLAVVWIILRFVMGLARRIFSLGCFLILALGLLLIVLRSFN